MRFPHGYPPAHVRAHEDCYRLLNFRLNHYMKPVQFYRMVVEMRKLQKMYDRGHAPSVLRQAREIERIIDAEIDRVEQIIQDRHEQKELFDK